MIRLNTRVMPSLSLCVVHDKHVVGEVFAEPELGVVGLDLRRSGSCHCDFHSRQRLLFYYPYSANYNTKI